MFKILRDTHIIINLDHLISNINEIKNFANENVEIGSVLKADAYGHGAKIIAKTLYENGFNYFLVSTLIEGIELKKENPNYRVLIMGHTPNKYLEELVKWDLECTIFSIDQALLLDKFSKFHNKIIKVHIKIDTGFNRLGIKPNKESLDIIKKINKFNNIKIIGIFSHLSLKDNESDLKQFNLFKNFINNLENENINIKYKHICDSIATVLYREFQMSMIRIGAIMYGLESEEKGILNLKQVMSFHTKASYIKELKKGEAVSYGRRWVANKNSIIATLPFGYADGYPRNLYQKGFVTINNQKAPIIGVICMDQCMVDITEIKNFNINEDIIIFNDGENNTMSISDLAKLSETNKNDIVSRFSKRVPKIYIQNKNIVDILNPLIL